MTTEPTAAATQPPRNKRKTFIGVVTSDKMQKTAVVNIERLVRHPRFGKFVKRFTKCYVHDEKGVARRGDRVEIMETRPLSRLKRWRLVRVIERAGRGTAQPKETAAKS